MSRFLTLLTCIPLVAACSTADSGSGSGGAGASGGGAGTGEDGAGGGGGQTADTACACDEPVPRLADVAFSLARTTLNGLVQESCADGGLYATLEGVFARVDATHFEVDTCAATGCADAPAVLEIDVDEGVVTIPDGTLVHLDAHDCLLQVLNVDAIGNLQNPVAQGSFLWLGAGSGYVNPDGSIPLPASPLIVRPSSSHTVPSNSGSDPTAWCGISFWLNGDEMLGTACEGGSWAGDDGAYTGRGRIGEVNFAANYQTLNYWVRRDGPSCREGGRRRERESKMRCAG